MATEAGGARCYLKALTADQSAYAAAIPAINSIDGTVSDVRTAFATATWTEITPILSDVTIKFANKWEDIRPSYSLFRTGEIEIERGIEQIKFNWGERDIATIQKILAQGTTGTIAAAQAQCAQSFLKLGLVRDYSPVYYHAALLWENENSLATVMFVKKVRIDDTIDLVFGNTVTKLPTELKCFAWEAATAGTEIAEIYEITAGHTA